MAIRTTKIFGHDPTSHAIIVSSLSDEMLMHIHFDSGHARDLNFQLLYSIE